MVIGGVLALLAVLAMTPGRSRAQVCQDESPGCLEHYFVLLQVALPLDLQFLKDDSYHQLSPEMSRILEPAFVRQALNAVAQLVPDNNITFAAPVPVWERAWSMSVQVNFTSVTEIFHPIVLMPSLAATLQPLVTATLQEYQIFGSSVFYTRIAYVHNDMGMCDGAYRALNIKEASGSGVKDSTDSPEADTSDVTPDNEPRGLHTNDTRPTAASSTIPRGAFSGTTTARPKRAGGSLTNSSIPGGYGARNSSMSSFNSGTGCLPCFAHVIFLSAVALLASFGAN